MGRQTPHAELDFYPRNDMTCPHILIDFFFLPSRPRLGNPLPSFFSGAARDSVLDKKPGAAWLRPHAKGRARRVKSDTHQRYFEGPRPHPQVAGSPEWLVRAELINAIYRITRNS